MLACLRDRHLLNKTAKVCLPLAVACAFKVWLHVLSFKWKLQHSCSSASRAVKYGCRVSSPSQRMMCATNSFFSTTVPHSLNAYHTQVRSAATTSTGPLPNPVLASAIPPDVPEVGEWDDECFCCGIGGKLTCCDACPRVYHLRCLPSTDHARLRLPNSADVEWWCPRCRWLARATFCMTRELTHPITSTLGAADDIAHRLFSFVSDQQQQDDWEPLRETGAALLHALPQSSPWQPSNAPSHPTHNAGAVDGPGQQAADQLASRSTPEWYGDWGEDVGVASSLRTFPSKSKRSSQVSGVM